MHIKTGLRKQNPYTTLGMLLGEVSHEILHPLTGVYAPLENLERRCETLSCDNKAELKGYFERIYTNLECIEHLVKSLKMFCYTQEIPMRTINIEQSILAVLEIFQEKIRDHIRVTYTIARDVVIHGNPEALMHILLNLVSNAIDAITPSGEIRIVVERQNCKSLIRITDSGCGIEPGQIARIFEPLYTSKAMGKGTGLGLYIVSNLVQRMGWRIDVHSTIGKGTTFIITTA